MSRNGSGVYTPPAASYPAVSGTLIEAAKFNAVIDDVATALTESVAINGQTAMTGDLPMGSHKVTGLANGVAAADAATVGQVAMRGANADITSLGALTEQTGHRNVIINGAMEVSQEFGTSSTPIIVNTWKYVVDQIMCTTSGANVTADQIQLTGPGPEGTQLFNAIRFNGATSAANPTIGTRIEARDSWHLAGKQVTFSVWAYQNTGSSMTIDAYINRATTTDNFSAVTLDVSLTRTPTTIPSDVWTEIRATGTLSSGAITGLEPVFIIAGALGAGKICYFSYLQLEAGSVATKFEHRLCGETLALCQRYCRKLGATSGAGQATSGTNARIVSSGVPMRITPALSTTTGHFVQDAAGSGIAVTAVPSITGGSEDGNVIIQTTVASGLVGGDGTLFAPAAGTVLVARL